MKRFVLFAVLGLFFTGCGGPLVFNPPANLNYQITSDKIPMTVGIYVPPEIKGKQFEPCEKLMFGSTQCYTGDIGAVLETNAVSAYSQVFSNVKALNSHDDFSGVDIGVELSYVSEELTTTLDGPVAYRTVALGLGHRYLYPESLASDSSKVYTAQTHCKAAKCSIGGVEEGMSGTEIVLKQLFLPGFAFSGYGKTLANIVNTAFCASLKDNLESSVLDTKKAAAGL